MPIGSELTSALQEFAGVERAIVALGRGNAASNALELVRVRRDLVLQFAKLGSALERDPHLKDNPDQMTQATRLFAAFRSANSINQANWPAIRVRDNLEEYLGASLPVADASRAFWTWVDQHLGFRRGSESMPGAAGSVSPN